MENERNDFFQRGRFSWQRYCSISEDVRQVSELSLFFYNYFEKVHFSAPSKKLSKLVARKTGV